MSERDIPEKTKLEKKKLDEIHLPRPTWMTVIAVFMLIFGALGFFSGVSNLIMPELYDIQHEALEDLEQRRIDSEKERAEQRNPVSDESLEQESEITTEGSKDSEKDLENFPIIKEFIHGLSNDIVPPQWYIDSLPLIGSITMAVSLFYILSGVLLLRLSVWRIKAFLLATISSIASNSILIVVLAGSGNFLLKMQIPGALTSIFIDIILVVVTLTFNRKFMRQVVEHNEMMKAEAERVGTE